METIVKSDKESDKEFLILLCSIPNIGDTKIA